MEPFTPSKPRLRAAAPAELAFALFACVLVLATWVLARPYIGVRHDGLLYLGQVLLHWRPDIFSQDLFFQFGSQDRFSISAPVMAMLYRHVDVAVAQIALITTNQLVLLLAGLAWMRRAGLNGRDCVLGLVALGVMSHNYGGWGIFAFSERFVTGRTFAEPFALVALLLIERGRILSGIVAMGASLVFHPLVAVPAAVVAWGVLVARDRRWAWALLWIPAAAAVGLAGVDPFSRLVSSFDEEWFNALHKANGHIFVVGWHIEDLLTVALDCAVLWAAARAYPALATLLRVTVVMTASLLAVSAIMVDGLHNILLTQLQLWRVHWITHALALLFLPALLLQTWRKGDLVAQTLALALAAAAVSANVRYPSTIGLTAWCVLALWLHVKKPSVDQRLMKFARVATGLALAGVSALVVAEAASQLKYVRGMELHVHGYQLNLAQLVLLGVTAPVVSLPLTMVLLHAWQRGRVAAAAALTLVAAGAVFGFSHWDQRAAWTRYLEENLQAVHPWEKIIGPTQQVLWWDEAARVWGLIHRPSYYSILQGAGVLFNRGTALEHQRRGGVTRAIQFQKDVCDVMSTVGAEGVDGECWPTMEAIEEACGADEQLAFVILNRKLPRGVIADWTPSPNGTTFYLHDCKQIR